MRYHNITKEDMLNGDGLRIVLWVAGCSHCCRDCHNPVTWDANGGLPFDEAVKAEIFTELSRDYIAGLTLSGGDPLFATNRSDTLSFVKEVKEKFSNKTIWLYTGFVWEAIRELEIMQYVDVVVDGEFVAALKNTGLHWRGSSNQRVIKVKESQATGQMVLHCE